LSDSNYRYDIRYKLYVAFATHELGNIGVRMVDGSAGM